MEGVLLFYKYVQYYPKFPNEYEEKRANAGLYQEKNLDYMRNMYIEIYGK